MYDAFTSAGLFLLLVPGIILTIPPSGGISAAVVHAIVFYVLQTYVSQYIPWWGIWIAVAVVVVLKLFVGRSTPTY